MAGIRRWCSSISLTSQPTPGSFSRARAINPAVSLEESRIYRAAIQASIQQRVIDSRRASGTGPEAEEVESAGFVSRDHAQKRGCVFHRACEGTDVIERTRESREPIKRDTRPYVGMATTHAAERGRLGATIRPYRSPAKPRPCLAQPLLSGSPARSARHAIRRNRGFRTGPEGRVFTGRPHCELVGVRFSDQDTARLFQTNTAVASYGGT